MTVPPCMPDAIWRSSPGSDASRTETQWSAAELAAALSNLVPLQMANIKPTIA